MKHFLPIFFFILALIGAVTVVNTVHRVVRATEHATIELLK